MDNQIETEVENS